jgi:hypothetical protein
MATSSPPADNGDRIISALVNFKRSLTLTASSYEEKRKESSALAVIAVLTLMKELEFEDYLAAPLFDVVDDLERQINTRHPGYRFGISIIENMSKAVSLAAEGKKVPTISEPGATLSAHDIRRVIAALAIEYQVEVHKSIPNALEALVGRHSKAAKSLKTVRDNIKEKDSPKGSREYFYRLKGLANQMPASEAAEMFIRMYKASLGKKS